LGEKRPRPVVLWHGWADRLLTWRPQGRCPFLSWLKKSSVPAGALAQVWGNSAKQVRLARLVRTEEVEVHLLDEQAVCAVGQFCGATGTADVIDASVVLVARSVDGIAVLSGPGDMKNLDLGASVVACQLG
jgi:hypothetical protein